MASLTTENDRGRTGWRLQFRQNGKRRSLWLGSMSKRAADAVARHIEELVRAESANVGAAPEAVTWAGWLVTDHEKQLPPSDIVVRSKDRR